MTQSGPGTRAADTATTPKNPTTPNEGKRPDGRLVRGEQRRREILRTAVEVFGEQGFRGSSLREIAARVGISEAGLLHHFGSKAALLTATIEERSATESSTSEDPATSDTPTSDTSASDAPTTTG